MNRILYVLAVTSLLMGNSSALSDDAKTELKRLQGTWKVVRAESGGKDVKELLGHEEVAIEGNSSVVRYKGEVLKSRFKIDPTKTPKQITFITPKGEEVHGVYELKGDTWKILVSKVGEGRPKSLKDPGLLFEYKKGK